MKFLWDTDTCIYFLNGDKSIKNRISLVGAENICASILTIAELRYGCYKSSKMEQNIKKVQRLQELICIIDNFDDEIATLFGKNKVELQKQGIIIGDIDLLISCFALAQDLILVTNNVKHYKNIPNLKIENWYNSKIA